MNRWNIQIGYTGCYGTGKVLGGGGANQWPVLVALIEPVLEGGMELQL